MANQSVNTGMLSNRASASTIDVPLLLLDASSMINGASIIGSASEPAMAIWPIPVNVISDATITAFLILAPRL